MKVLFSGPPTTSFGRNGVFKTTGLLVNRINVRHHDDPQAGQFMLEALTSRGTAASGHFTLPVNEVPALIVALQQELHAYHLERDTYCGYEPEVALPDQPNGRIIVTLPCGREVHVHRDGDNIGTIVDVYGGPNAEQIGETLTYFDSDNALDEDGD